MSAENAMPVDPGTPVRLNKRKQLPRKDVLTVTLSSLALLISLTSLVISLYFQYFWQSHDLKASVIDRSSSELAGGDASLHFQVLLVNRGNQNEVILNVQFLASKTLRTNSGRRPDVFDVWGRGIGPFILKPGEASLREIKLKRQDYSQTPEFAVLFEVVTPSGHTKETYYWFARVEGTGANLWSIGSQHDKGLHDLINCSGRACE